MYAGMGAHAVRHPAQNFLNKLSTPYIIFWILHLTLSPRHPRSNSGEGEAGSMWYMMWAPHWNMSVDIELPAKASRQQYWSQKRTSQNS